MLYFKKGGLVYLNKDTMIWGALAVVLLVFIGSQVLLLNAINTLGSNMQKQGSNGQPQIIAAPQGTQQPGQPVVVKTGSHLQGDANAPVTIIEFSDFQCPFCGRFYTDALPQIEANYIKTGKAKLYYRQFPLVEIHPFAQKAAEASECASDQGKFWEYHNLLFADQQALDVPSLKADAKKLGLDSAKFDACLDGGVKASIVSSDTNDGLAAGVSGTPSFYINGHQLVGAQPFSAFQQIIDPLLK